MFLIAYTSLHISNRTALVLLGTLGGYILRFLKNRHEFYSNVPVKWVFWTLCLGGYLPDPTLSGGLLLGTSTSDLPLLGMYTYMQILESVFHLNHLLISIGIYRYIMIHDSSAVGWDEKG